MSSKPLPAVCLAARARNHARGALALSALLLLGPASGCTTYHVLRWEPPPEGREQIKVGVARQTVEGILGSPVGREGAVHTYEFSTQEGPNLAFLPFTAFVDVFYLGGIGLAQESNRRYEGQRTRLSIAYGPDDRVVSLAPTRGAATLDHWLAESERDRDLSKLCEAANDGSADAHAVQAVRYRYGLWDTGVDPVKAYVSMRLAAHFGSPGAQGAVESWRARMDPAEIAEADQLYASWQPGPCDETKEMGSATGW